MTASYRFAFLAALAVGAACSVHGDKMPALAGPSEFATSITVTTTPDSIVQDGRSKASIAVTARDVNGKGISALSLRLDMAADPSVLDYGLLSARTLVTGTDGRATAEFTAPPPFATPPISALGTPVTFLVTPIGSNYQTQTAVSAELLLVQPGGVLPPVAPTPSFTVSPSPPVPGPAPTTFDASSSCAGSPPCSSTAGITSFEWSFGDTTFGSGERITHVFPRGNATYTVVLSVTNNRGVRRSMTQKLEVTAEVPKALFVYSPTDPQPGDVITFNASASTAPFGSTLTQFIWNFGKGAGNQLGTSLMTERYDEERTYVVVLTVVDDAGRTVTGSQTVTVKKPAAPTK